jgi:hypothetical protein
MESGESAVLNRRFNLGHSCARGVLDLLGGGPAWIHAKTWSS